MKNKLINLQYILLLFPMISFGLIAIITLISVGIKDKRLLYRKFIPLFLIGFIIGGISYQIINYYIFNSDISLIIIGIIITPFCMLFIKIQKQCFIDKNYKKWF